MDADRTAADDAPPRPGGDAAEIEALVRAFQAGTEREESFHALYRAYAGRLGRFFGRKGLGAEECLDLTQETFLGIYTGLEGFRWEARFDTWLYRIANTTYLKRVRAGATAKRRGHEVSTDDVSTSDSALRIADGQLDELLVEERRGALREAVAELPDQMRRCLTLRIYHELAYREIASLLRIKIDTVKAHLFQARKKLEVRLGETIAPDPEL